MTRWPDNPITRLLAWRCTPSEHGWRLGAARRHNAVHPQILHQLAVVVVGVYQVFKGQAETCGCALRPGRNSRRGQDGVSVVNGGRGAVHLDEGILDVGDDVSF